MSTALDVIRKKAREAHASQQLLVAEQHYRTLLAEEPNIDDVINLGALLRSQGRLEEGSLFYKSWINRFDSDARLILNACNCWNDNNEAQIGLNHLEKLIQSKKADVKILFCYADTLSRLNRQEDCKKVLNECIRYDSKNKEAWVRMIVYTRKVS